MALKSDAGDMPFTSACMCVLAIYIMKVRCMAVRGYIPIAVLAVKPVMMRREPSELRSIGGEDWMSIADDRSLVTRGQDFQEGNGLASERLGIDNDIAKTDFAHNGYEIVSEMGQTILAHETHLEKQQTQQTL